MSGTETKYHWVRVLLICIFSLAIIFLGTKELYRKYFVKLVSTQKEPKDLMRALHNEFDMRRLIRDPKYLVAELKERKEPKPIVETNLKEKIQKILP